MKREIKFTIEVDGPKQERLLRALNCQEPKLTEELAYYAKAALSEYIEMFCGISSIRTIGDVREQRLLQIMLADEGRELPTDPIVSRLFHITYVQARTLLRSVFEKRDFEMRVRLQNACIAAVQKVDQTVNPHTLTIKNPRVYEALDRILAEAGNVPLLTRTNSASVYQVDKNSLPVLQQYFKPGGN